MSAISALWNRGSGGDAQRPHERILAALELYGPDDSAAWHSGAIAMGRTLMRAVPEDVLDVQPAWGRDRQVCMVANVRLDNRSDLIRELGLVRPEEHSDVSILLAVWERW